MREDTSLDVFSLFYIYLKQSEMDDMIQLVVLDSLLIKSILYSVSKRVYTFNVVCMCEYVMYTFSHQRVPSE